MNSHAQQTTAEAGDLAGDLAPLVERLGSPEGLVALGEAGLLLGCPRIDSLESLHTFLVAYRRQWLEPVELPAILRAWRHASRFEARELIALDRELAADPRLQPFAGASLHAGRHQLRRLRPLHDQKLVQRYLAALDAGQAAGWHTLVYGVTLAVYSLPPRQGLLNYACQTLAGFAHSASRRLSLSEAQLNATVDDTCASLAVVVNKLVEADSNPLLLTVEPRAALLA